MASSDIQYHKVENLLLKMSDGSSQTVVANGLTLHGIEGNSSMTLHPVGSDANLALSYYHKHIDYTEKDDRAVVRKIDRRIMPLLAITYGIQFLDKITLGYAANYGLEDDDHLVKNEYNWLGSAFYFAYLVSEWPAVTLMQKFKISKFLALCVFIWGGVLMCHAAAHNFFGLIICRLFLGFFEASIAPGCSLLTGRFYKSNEIPLRIGFWASFTGLSQFLGGLLIFAIGHIKSSLPPWKYIFLVLGAVTCLWAIVLYFFLESSPTEARFLNERERAIAVARIAENKSGLSLDSNVRRYQLIDALTDPQIIIIFLFTISMTVPNGGITNFMSLLTKGFGFSATEAVWHQLPGGIISFVFILFSAYMISNIPNSRINISIFALLIAVICAALLWQLPRSDVTGLLVTTYFINTYGVPSIAIYSWLNTNVAGTTKRGTAHAIHFIGYCIGNSAGPFLFKESQAPKYDDGCIMMLTCFSVGILLLIILRVYYTHENYHRRKHLMELNIDPKLHKVESEKLGFLDKTDRENPYFFYSL